MLSRKINIDYIVLLLTFTHFTSIICSQLFKFAILNNFLNTLLDSTIITIYKRLHSYYANTFVKDIRESYVIEKICKRLQTI